MVPVFLALPLRSTRVCKMQYVSAKYVNGFNDIIVVQVMGDDGQSYYLDENSEVSPWPEYLAMGGTIDPLEPAIELVPDRVSRRQFRLALIDADMLELVEGWIATQDIRTRAAYADSGTFVRSDEMLQSGFAALGFTTDQIDEFFTDAAAL